LKTFANTEEGDKQGSVLEDSNMWEGTCFSKTWAMLSKCDYFSSGTWQRTFELKHRLLFCTKLEVLAVCCR